MSEPREDVPAGSPGDSWEMRRQLSPSPLPPDRRVDEHRAAPTVEDPLIRALSPAVGGSFGRHGVVGRNPAWTPLRVLLLLALIGLAIGWFGKSPCLQQTVTNSGAIVLDTAEQRMLTHLCYADTIGLYGAERLTPGDLADGAFPYRTSWYEPGPDGAEIQRFMEYPVLTGMYMYAAAQGARAWTHAMDSWGVPGALDVVLFFNLVALGLALCWLVALWATSRVAGDRVWWLWLMALSPLVLVHAFTNFDALAVMLTALAMLAWSRRDPLFTGVFIGLGVAAKLYPGLLLVVLLALCLRSGRLRAFAVTAAAAAVTWLLVNLPILVAYPQGWLEFFRLNRRRGADPDSLYQLVTELTGITWPAGVLNALSAVLLVAVMVGVIGLGYYAPHRPRVPQLLFLMVAGFLLVNKVWSPQYSLWLVPLAILALPRTRLLLSWMIVDALLWVPRMGIFMDADRPWLPDEWFYLAVAVRGALVVAMCVVVIGHILRPERDPVRNRRPGIDDPAGGILDGAPDAPTLPGIAARLRRRRDPVATPAASPVR